MSEITDTDRRRQMRENFARSNRSVVLTPEFVEDAALPGDTLHLEGLGDYEWMSSEGYWRRKSS